MIENKNSRLPLPQRYINKKDMATLKAIEIIGREKYAQLLDENLIIVDYKTITLNQRNHREHISRLNKTIEILTTLPIQSNQLRFLANPSHQNQCLNLPPHQLQNQQLHTSPIYPWAHFALLSQSVTIILRNDEKCTKSSFIKIFHCNVSFLLGFVLRLNYNKRTL